MSIWKIKLTVKASSLNIREAVVRLRRRQIFFVFSADMFSFYGLRNTNIFLIKDFTKTYLKTYL